MFFFYYFIILFILLTYIICVKILLIYMYYKFFEERNYVFSVFIFIIGFIFRRYLDVYCLLVVDKYK